MAIPVAAPAGKRMRHQPLPHAPWYAGAAEGMTLHRYLDEQFVPRFLKDAGARALAGTLAQAWHQDDRFGRYKDYPQLRLPMHRAFYISCCEVSCEIPGLPPFDPNHIRSAGLVIRRGLPGKHAQIWWVRDGLPRGWKQAQTNGEDPDIARRAGGRARLPAGTPEPPFTGEESYPMHALRVERSASGDRPRTLLWGYLPLGGSYRLETSPPVSQAEASAMLKELPWPFGSGGLISPWGHSHARPVLDGLASGPFVKLLEVLVRDRVFDPADPDNTELRQVLHEIHFYPRPDRFSPLSFNFHNAPLSFNLHNAPLTFDRHDAPIPGTEGESLRDWLDASFMPLQDWLSKALVDGVSASPRLPRLNAGDDPEKKAGEVMFDLYLTEDLASRLRTALLARALLSLTRNEVGLGVPRFGQGKDDIFHAVGYVRWKDACGCEQVRWGKPSLPFRVASPFEPEAQRPIAIQLPNLDDLRRGSAKGIAMLAPASLADRIRKVGATLPPAPTGPGNLSGLCWTFGLSIPVVTICALILLMILINILNMIFRWLPWAFLPMPRPCAPPPPVAADIPQETP